MKESILSHFVSAHYEHLVGMVGRKDLKGVWNEWEVFIERLHKDGLISSGDFSDALSSDVEVIAHEVETLRSLIKIAGYGFKYSNSKSTLG